MPPPPLNALEIPHEEEVPFQGACAGIPPEGEIEHTTDVRILNQLVVGLNPNEVFAAFQVSGRGLTLQNPRQIKCMRKQVQ